MASRIIGRAACPECGFEHAHIKESERCIYRYCPACGINGPHARTALQRQNMVKGMRPVQPTATPTPTPTEDKPAPAAAPTAPTPTPTKRREASPPADPPPAPPPPATPTKRSGLFGFALGE